MLSFLIGDVRNYLEEKIQQIGFKYIYEEELNHEMHFKYKHCKRVLELLGPD